jgi:hypothetical protein
MANILKTIWMEAIVAQFKVPFQLSLRCTEDKYSVNISDLRAEI